MEPQVWDLYAKSVGKETLRRYRVAWDRFLGFLDSKGLSVNGVVGSTVAEYIAVLFAQGLSSSGIGACVAAVGFFLPAFGVEGATECALVRRVLAGVRRERPCCDSRAPLSRVELVSLCHVLDSENQSSYDRVLFKAILTLSFFGCLRLSEAVGKHALKFGDVRVENGCVWLVFRSYKKKRDHLPVSVRVRAEGDVVCPVRMIGRYLEVRPRDSGMGKPLFVFASGVAVSPRHFTGLFARWVRVVCDADRVVSSHSLRIGGATNGASLGD